MKLFSSYHDNNIYILGIIGGDGYGVNPSVKLIDVRIANADGYARADAIVAGLDFVLGKYLMN